MQVEWNIKYPTRHKPRERCFQGPVGRVQSFLEVFKHIHDTDMILYIHANYIDYIDKNTIDNVSLQICLLSDLIL